MQILKRATDFIWSPNYSDRGNATVDRVVIHITDGGPSARNTASWFKNPASEVSAHVIVGNDGSDVIQCVSLDKKAWHAGSFNARSVGIEHCARSQFEVSRTGQGNVLPLTPEQLLASAEVTREVCAYFAVVPSRETIIGHDEVPGQTHADCPSGVEFEGMQGWPWDLYLSLVRNPVDIRTLLSRLFDATIGPVADSIFNRKA